MQTQYIVEFVKTAQAAKLALVAQFPHAELGVRDAAELKHLAEAKYELADLGGTVDLSGADGLWAGDPARILNRTYFNMTA